ncbi:hypothetical protein QBC33DRAFT_495072 [Phialemonium atrogriseum]|uniref:Zn(2)-C6 fungal-type domain-containing protein n=1 Tax=Phialemonium atrogriseum TaxID=1093897 RepID=A0AAJ0BWS7_9PEZI|nr:uncharacterized protein QBC33DRAFT_495072 [Phialemonium atrogriseum]KAK1765730.1 hypothetical protein QBC33DRAFT_495072 [Phialemonium atrogriseum]
MARASESAPAIENESPAPAPARIRRNTACVRCRDAKVKCNASLNPNQTCSRCSKSGLPCVFDRNHKRASGRSKLEELAAEVRNIKEAVGPRALSAAMATPPVRQELPSLPLADSQPFTNHLIPSSTVSNVTASFTAPGLGGFLQVQTPSLTTYTTPSPPSGLPAEPRALGSRVLPSEDIDYYFTKYFDHFHPHLPVVRTRDPNACYKSGPLLFWAIIVTACRRYARDEGIFQFLVDSISSEVWAAAAQPPLRPPTISALLLLVTWPLPTIRFISDPSNIYAGIALNSCLTIGLQTGKGCRPEFCGPLYRLETTDEEATYTWAACNILCQRISSYIGYPSTASLFGKSIDRVLDGTISWTVPRSFIIQLETARFSNRLSKTVAACLEEAPGVSHHLVAQMEEEFAKLQKFSYPDNADQDNFTLLLTLLDLQIYYLMPLPGFSEEILKRNVLRCYNTAQSLVRLALKLQRDTAFLTHAPHFVFRALLAASCVFLTFQLSSYALAFEGDSGEALIGDALAAMRACSVQEGDLPVRASNMMEKYWSVRHRIPKSDDWKSGPSCFAHRLGASIAFDCLRKWKKELEQVRSSASNLPEQGPGLPEADATTFAEGPQASLGTAEEGLNDNLQQLDWNAFMDDFDWSFTSNYLNVS